MDIFISDFKVPLTNEYKLQDVYHNFQIYISNQFRQDLHYDRYIQDNNIYLFFGKLYTTVENPAFYITNAYLKNKNIADIDGEYIYIIINNLKTIIIYTDKEGIIPIYYSYCDNKLSITTDQKLLFHNFNKDDIHIESINDFLRFGTLLGDYTFSKKVKLIEGGMKWQYTNGDIQQKRYHLFHFDSQNSIKDIKKLIYNVSQSYMKAIKKRITEKEVDDSCIFMSGGIDSRFLLALLNKTYTNKKIHTYSFGQPHSEEVDIARKCATLYHNPFDWLEVKPENFIENIDLYSQMTCGADMFPQSYIINIAKQIEKSNFLTGFALDAYLGGTFLNEDAVETSSKLSTFVTSHLKLIKMNALSDEILKKICKKGIYETIFSNNDRHLIEVAEEYDKYPTKDSIQPFAINNRAKRLVLLRELIPAKYINYSCVSLDKDFLKSIALIPAKLRNNHYFYQKLFINVAPEYANIVYNNTTLPISADLSLWNTGVQNESRREKMFQTIMQNNDTLKDKQYYPHFYSDFDGYSRYDSQWKELIADCLLNKDSFINQYWFKETELNEMYNQHIQGNKNYRKELIYLTSLEIFLRNFLKQ